MKRRLALSAVFAIACGCGGAPPRANQYSIRLMPPDESRRFPLADQVSATLVDDHILGKDFLPGGNVAEYRRKGKSYRQFLMHVKTNEDAALLMFDFKGHLREPKYLPHMGGYFGMDGATPVYLFQKGPFLAGFAGLPEKEADSLARQFAARLN